MRVILFLLRKEFVQIFRNRMFLPMIFAMPLVQLLVLPLAANYEMKNIVAVVVDHDRSMVSQQLVEKIAASGYFRIHAYPTSFDEAFSLIEGDRGDLILEIPKDFESRLIERGGSSVFIAVNAINGIKASLGGAYLRQILTSFSSELRERQMPVAAFPPLPLIRLKTSVRFNPIMSYRHFMVPGFLVLLVTIISTYMCGLHAVKEKENGSIEQINVSPVKKYQFILGKLIPFWILGVVVFSLGLFVVARWVYGILPVGSLLLLYAYLLLYLVAMLGLGLLVSTYCHTQQQVMFTMFFFMMIFILMSGLFTPIESMPRWAYLIACCSPITYFTEVARMVILKGSDFSHLHIHIGMMSFFALLFNSWAVINYKKTL